MAATTKPHRIASTCRPVPTLYAHGRLIMPATTRQPTASTLPTVMAAATCTCDCTIATMIASQNTTNSIDSTLEVSRRWPLIASRYMSATSSPSYSDGGSGGPLIAASTAGGLHLR